MPPPAVLAPPVEVLEELARVRARLDETVPAKQVDRNLLLATWNLRAFGDLNDAWIAPPGTTPARDGRSLAIITEILSRFDVVAIQEVKGNLRALRHLLRALGDDWAFLLTDVTKGAAGNGERMAFLFDTRRVRPSGLASELVLPPEWKDTAIGPAATVTQFARSPYGVSFLSAGRGYRQTFILLTLHVLYGARSEDRLGELGAIAQWVADMARDVNAYDQNLIVLGDFNIDRKGDPGFQAFTSTGLEVPAVLQDLPRTIFDGGKDKFYDQIAWFAGADGVPALSLHHTGKGGHVDVTDLVFAGLTKQQQSWKLSDHYPLWIEFGVQPGDPTIDLREPTP